MSCNSLTRPMTIVALVCLMAIVQPLFAEDGNEETMSKEFFLSATERIMENACDDSESPFHCMSQDLSRCRSALMAATAGCMDVLHEVLPEKIDKEIGEASKHGFANCIRAGFRQHMGDGHIDESRCYAGNRK